MTTTMTMMMMMTADAAAPLARALLPLLRETLAVVPDADRGPVLGAVDAFVASPVPSRFLAAVRELRQARARALIELHGGGTLQRARAAGLAALRDVPGFPGELVDRLQDCLPTDLRSGPRLQAVAVLARSYHELAARVTADSEQMRQRLREAYPRRSGKRPRPPS